MKQGALPILVSLVTYNDEDLVAGCLRSLEQQTVAVRIRVFDNNSQDNTCAIIRTFGVELHPSPENCGYGGGHNHNLLDQNFELALLLNADVVLKPDYLERLMAVLDEMPEAGMAGGKLYRMSRDGKRVERQGRPLLDSTGIFFTPSQRHFDRGSQEPDLGQYQRRQLVFGITGAALLCRRAMLEDVRFENEYLDADFFAYREDADLAWRAQLRDWKAVYEPSAEALHLRHVLPERRRRLSRLINYHSLKNRYLMRIKNMDAAVRRRCFPHLWIRDLGILGYVLFLEWSSLPAYLQVWRLRHRFQEKRRQVQGTRRQDPAALARWFSFTPVAFEVGDAAGGGEAGR